MYLRAFILHYTLYTLSDAEMSDRMAKKSAPGWPRCAQHAPIISMRIGP